MTKLKQSTFLLFFLLITGFSMAQNSQTVRGTIVDKQSEIPLIGVAVELISVDPIKGEVTNEEGRFSMSNVPLGRHTFRISYLGYNPITIPNVVVTAGKEVTLDLGLEESYTQLDEVVVTAQTDKDKTVNEMASISARSFNLEEVTRFSGGRNDAARLVGNFAGVSVADDSRNDIVIRGNSPTGVLWRLEGIPIPNPNHFSTLGTTGGPVSALNPNLLATSDFLTSAFPAEYGNAIGGVFDVNFRSGNREKYEFTAQLAAFSGLEAMIEGPLNKNKKGAFLASYRYSFVEIADYLGIPVGTNATPKYQDLSFKIDFGNSKAGKFSLFGIGALSNIEFLGEETEEDDLFADPNSDAYSDSKIGILGLRHNIILGQNAYIRTVASFSTAQTIYTQDNLLDDGTRKLRVTDVDDVSDTYRLSSFYNKKVNARFTVRTGILAQHFRLKTTVDDRDNRPDLNDDGEPDWVRVRDFDGGMNLLEAYAQSQYKLSQNWTLNTGVHAQYLDFNESSALEPRMSLSWQFRPNQSLTLGYGLHHQMQPLPVFFLQEEVRPGVYERTNKNLDFLRSNHFVLGYDLRFSTDWRAKVEAYYQAIGNVAVERTPSSFSLLNAGADFVFPERYSLVNEGTGTNQGVELTLEKFFSKGYYGLFTASIFDSKYKGSDGIERNTAFNNNYVLNLLAGKEFKFGKDKRNAFTIDTKITTAGGRYYTPVDLEASKAKGEEVLLENQAFSERYDPYFRFDLKVGYTKNSKKRKFSEQFYLDFQNVTNKKNIFQKRYNDLTNEVNDVYQIGFFPDILYRIQF